MRLTKATHLLVKFLILRTGVCQCTPISTKKLICVSTSTSSQKGKVFFQGNLCQPFANWVHCEKRGREKSISLVIFWGWIFYLRGFARNSSTRRLGFGNKFTDVYKRVGLFCLRLGLCYGHSAWSFYLRLKFGLVFFLTVENSVWSFYFWIPLSGNWIWSFLLTVPPL